MTDFNEDLEFGQNGEKLFLKSGFIQETLHTTKIKKLEGNDQKFKGDYEAKGVYFEIKTMKPSYEYNAGKIIPIEMGHTGDNPNGWIDKYHKNTYMVYQWTRKKGNQFELVSPQICFPFGLLKNNLDWLKSLDIKISKNKNYDTKFVLVRLEDLKNRVSPLIRSW